MYREEKAFLARYAAEDPDDVGRELKLAAEMLAWAFEGLNDSQLSRRCVSTFPSPLSATCSGSGAKLSTRASIACAMSMPGCVQPRPRFARLRSPKTRANTLCPEKGSSPAGVGSPP